MLLSDIIAHAAPLGFFPAVVPGTQFVTLGGAIANDVHGKNHHRRGTFGCHVEALTLLRSDGRDHRLLGDRQCAALLGDDRRHGADRPHPRRNDPADAGCLRSTSSSGRRRFRPRRISSTSPRQADAENEYAVAWIDQLASGRRAGRGLLLTGNHSPHGARRPAGAGVASRCRSSRRCTLLNRPFLKLFNAAYRWQSAPAGPRHGGYQGFFFPLDGVGDWNRLYGPNGLYQHQSIVPDDAARIAVPALLKGGPLCPPAHPCPN